MLTIDEIKKSVVPLAQSYGAERVFLFGSYARGEATPQSDIDLRIDKGKIVGIQLGGFYADLEEKLNHSIDLLTTEQLSHKFLDHIKNEEILLYERT
ncbi:MAG: nucleotidyltransferase domain-containing protein [Smithella sp.]